MVYTNGPLSWFYGFLGGYEDDFAIIDNTGAFWIIGAAAAAMLGYTGPDQATVYHKYLKPNEIQMLDDNLNPTTDPKKGCEYISEIGFYKLILNTDSPMAMRFKDIVAEQVLPGLSTYSTTDPNM